MCCSREDYHLHLQSVADKKIIENIIIFIFNVLQTRGSPSSSSFMCCSWEDHHLHLLLCVAVERIHLHHLTYVVTAIERIIIFIFSYVLQLRGSSSSSSSSICCSREGRHLLLSCVAAKRIFFSHVLQSKGSLSPSSLCVVVKNIIIFIFNVLQSKGFISHVLWPLPRGSSFSSSSSSYSMCRSREDHHLHILLCVVAKRIHLYHLTCVVTAAERIFIFIFSHVLQPRGFIFNFSHVLQPKGS